MFEQIILGIIQGVAEWLPVSSEGLIVLTVNNFLKELSLEKAIGYALLLHLGTFLAALIYFRKDVLALIRALFDYQKASLETRQILKFLILSTFLSGCLGFVLFKILTGLDELVGFSAKLINLVIGLFLIVTGLLQLRIRQTGQKKAEALTLSDGLWLGLAQGLAVLPGLSRSGLTVGTLLLRKFGSVQALRLSFLMSLPIVFLGNIILNFRELSFEPAVLWAVIASFVFGLLTISLILKIARKINFGYFAVVFGFLVIVSIFIY